MTKITAVEEYIQKHHRFSEELSTLRQLFLSLELNETIKWNMPTYTHNGKNIVGLGAFKAHCNIWFFQGGTLKDKHALLHNAQEGKTKAMRHMKIESKEAISSDIIQLYVKEAIENQKTGNIIQTNRNKALIIPSELQDILDKNDTLNDSFHALSKGKQREYCDHIAAAKRAQTKQSRLEKCIPLIKAGKGLHDKYRK